MKWWCKCCARFVNVDFPAADTELCDACGRRVCDTCIVGCEYKVNHPDNGWMHCCNLVCIDCIVFIRDRHSDVCSADVEDHRLRPTPVYEEGEDRLA